MLSLPPGRRREAMFWSHAVCHNPKIPTQCFVLRSQPENHLVATRRAVAETPAAALDLLDLSDGDDVDGDRVKLEKKS
jgi:hypothetical protein